jgi:hypothetical protein
LYNKLINKNYCDIYILFWYYFTIHRYYIIIYFIIINLL